MAFPRSERERKAQELWDYLMGVRNEMIGTAARIRRLNPALSTHLYDIRKRHQDAYAEMVVFRSDYGPGGAIDPDWFRDFMGRGDQQYQNAYDATMTSLQNVSMLWNAILVNYEAASGNIERMALSAADQEAAATAIETEIT